MTGTFLKTKRDNSRSTTIIGRPLLVVDTSCGTFDFLSREAIPPVTPHRFHASEPFTILGINPISSFSDISALAQERGKSWHALLGKSTEFQRERTAIDSAVNILHESQSCAQYRAFAKSYACSRKRFSRKKICLKLARAVLNQSPALVTRQRIIDLKTGGIFSVPLLISIALLIAILTIPMGGVTILGIAFFASTIMAAWGPFAILPIVVLLALGGLGAYWYRQFNHVFCDLQDNLSRVIDIMEAMSHAVEDVFFLQEFKTFQSDSRRFRVNQRKIHDEISACIDSFIVDLIAAFIKRLSALVQRDEGQEKMTPEAFFTFLKSHPGELRECFQQTLSQVAGKSVQLSQRAAE